MGLSKGIDMKAVRFHEHGGADRLRFEDAPEPVAGPGEIVVRVKACALNYLDIWERRGLPGLRLPMPHISGSDVAGVVESIGPGVVNVNPGDRTLVNPGLSCMHCEDCFRGDDNFCPRYSVLGFFTDGGYAELVKVPAVNALPYPENLEFARAAALPLVFMTAWHMLVTRCRVRAGEDVLVLGAGSGVGSAAIQIAKFFRARVITTAGSQEKLQKALELGADHVIDHTRQKIREEVKRITSRRGVDIVFEHIGAVTWEESTASLAPHGRLVTCGATTGNDVRLDLRHLFAKQISIMGSYMGSKHELLEVLKLVEAGHLRPVVSEVVPMLDAGRAQTLMEERRHFGKIVLVL
jgi:NADPH:quinone reductase-like Zn-dependent oxidoreductase